MRQQETENQHRVVKNVAPCNIWHKQYPHVAYNGENATTG